MGRHIKTDVPQVKEHFIPELPYLEKFKLADKMFKMDQEHGYERHHRVRPVPSLPNDLPVWVQTGDNQIPGRIIQPANTPRSYIVDVPSGQFWRNHLRTRPEPVQTTVEENSPTRVIETRSRTRAVIHPPERFTY